MKFTFIFVMLMSSTAFAGDLKQLSSKIAESMGYPMGKLIITDVKSEESSFEKASLIEAWRIEGETEHSFYPVVISLAEAGTFFNADVVALNAKIDALPNLPAPQGKGPFGSFSLDDGSRGGIHLASHRKSMAVVSSMTVPKQGIDVRISIECPYEPESLVPVAGGEQYLKNMAAGSGFDLKGLFIKISEIAGSFKDSKIVESERDTKLASQPASISSSNTPSVSTKPKSNVAAEKAEKVNFSHQWWLAISLLILFVIMYMFKSYFKKSQS